MTDTQLPKALQLAAMFDHPLPPDWGEMQAAAAELRRLNAREDELLHHVCVLQGMNNESLESIRALTAELEQARAILATPATPSQPVTLTDEEINSIWSDGPPGSVLTPWGIAKIRAIIAALREKEGK